MASSPLANLVSRNLLPAVLTLALLRLAIRTVEWFLFGYLDRAVRSAATATLKISAQGRIFRFLVVADQGVVPLALLVDPLAPGLIQQDAEGTEDDEATADGTADDLIIIPRLLHTIPKPARRLRHVQDQAEQLDDADHEGNDDGDDGQDDAVVQDGDLVAGEGRGRVQAHHQRAVGRVEQAHADGEEHGEDQDQPDGRAARGLDGGDAEERDLAGRVEAQAEEDAERVHFPGAVNHLEHALEHVEQAPGAVDLEPAFLLVAGVRGDQRLQLPHQPVQDVDVHDAQEDQEGGRHGCADDAAHLRKVVELVGDCRGGAGDNDGGDDDNGRVAKGEEHADCHGLLAGGDEAAGHQVDGRDVVCVQSMAKAKGVGQDGRGDERRVKMKNNANSNPDNRIDKGDQEDYGERRER